MKIVSNILSAFIILALVIIWLQGKPQEPEKMELSENALGCMVMAIYHEARGEDAIGQVAVAEVILNRGRPQAIPRPFAALSGRSRNSASRTMAAATG